MKMIFGIIVIIFIGGILLLMTGSNENVKANNLDNITQDSDTSIVKKTKVQDNPYHALREQSFNTTAAQLQLKLDNTKTIVYGVIMEWDITDAIVSLVAFQTGDASMYVSTGQIFIGGFAHENVKISALQFVEIGQEYLELAKPTTETPKLDNGCVRFYFLTNKGKYYIQGTVDNIESNKSNLTKLFDAGNNVITEYRKVTDNK